MGRGRNTSAHDIGREKAFMFSPKITALLAILALALPLVSYGPPAPSPWFIEHIAYVPLDFPPGILISDIQEADDYGEIFDYVVIGNSSVIPLYLIENPDEDIDMFEFFPSGVPIESGPMYKVLEGQAYVWGKKSNELEGGYDYKWRKDTIRDNSIWIYAYWNQVLTKTGVVTELEPLNQFDGERPGNVEIPEPQIVSLPLVYGSENISIPVMVYYTLNEEYISYSDFILTENFLNFLMMVLLWVIYLTPVFGIAYLIKIFARRAAS